MVSILLQKCWRHTHMSIAWLKGLQSAQPACSNAIPEVYTWNYRSHLLNHHMIPERGIHIQVVKDMSFVLCILNLLSCNYQLCSVGASCFCMWCCLWDLDTDFCQMTMMRPSLL
jgi:hypothetical protein